MRCKYYPPTCPVEFWISRIGDQPQIERRFHVCGVWTKAKAACLVGDTFHVAYGDEYPMVPTYTQTTVKVLRHSLRRFTVTLFYEKKPMNCPFDPTIPAELVRTHIDETEKYLKQTRQWDELDDAVRRVLRWNCSTSGASDGFLDDFKRLSDAYDALHGGR